MVCIKGVTACGPAMIPVYVKDRSANDAGRLHRERFSI
jgi:hypothetical protein